MDGIEKGIVQNVYTGGEEDAHFMNSYHNLDKSKELTNLDEMTNIETFSITTFDVVEKMEVLNQSFPTKVEPIDGTYGTTIIDKGNGLIVKLYRDNNFIKKYYYQDKKLFESKEKIADKTWKTTQYDDNGTAYSFKTAASINIGQSF